MSFLTKVKAWFSLIRNVTSPLKAPVKHLASNQEKSNKLAFLDSEIDEFMLPRGRMVAVEETAALKTIWKEVKATPDGCLPLYRDSKDNIVKIVSVAEVADKLASPKKELVGSDPVFMPMQTPLKEVFGLVLQHKIIIVVDEYGGTHGVITLSRLSQLIFDCLGNSSTTQEKNVRSAIKKRSANIFEVSGDTPISEIEEKFKISIADQDDDVDTIGGAVFQTIERVPVVGEKFLHPAGFYVHILEAEPRRIKKLRLCLIRNKEQATK